MVLTDLVKISLLAQTGPFWKNSQFALMSMVTFIFQSLDEDYNILSKLKKSSKNVHAAGLSMFHLLFFFCCKSACAGILHCKSKGFFETQCISNTSSAVGQGT